MTSSSFLNSSHADCYSNKTYLLCQTDSLTGGLCDEPFNETGKVSLANNGSDLVIHLSPFDKIELYFHVYYPLGKIHAYKKMIVDVCGLETVHISNHTDLTTEMGKN